MLPVFAYLDVEHLAVAWGAYRGVLVSAHAESSQDGCSISMMLAGILSNKNSVRFLNEFRIETIRQKKYPSLPSRMSSMYFFETLDDAERVGNWGGHFVRDNLAKIDLYPTESVARHDSNWITHAKLDSSGRIVLTDWIDAYWKGEPSPHGKPVWELLAQGCAVIRETALRQRAYTIIKNQCPLVVSILEISRIAADLGSDLGQVRAFLIDNSDGTASVNYYLDMRDADNEAFLAQVKNYTGPKNHKDIAVGGDKFQVPDLRPYSCTFAVDEPLTKLFLSGIHMNVRKT